MKEDRLEPSSFLDSLPIKKDRPLWAVIVSLLLHPVFMTTYSIALLFVYTDFKYIFANRFSDFMSMVMFFTCFMPLVSIYFYRRIGYINAFSIETRHDRLVPFFTTVLSYGVLFFIFYKGGLYTWFLAIVVASTILLVLGNLICIWWKISMHMIGIGGLIGSVFSIAYNIKQQNPYELFIILIILAGILGVARLILKKNTPAQVYGGFLVGLSVSYLTIFIAWYYPIIYLLIFY